MKKTFLVLMLGSMMMAAACGGNKDEAANDNQAGGDTAAAQAEAPATPAPAGGVDKEKALELIAQADCLTCHKVEEKLVGPAYRDVANKYVADEQTKTLLAEKIIKGGSGVWGQVPMTPHPNISEEDAKTMVSYILSLKQN